jgi:hypothetical protein
MLAAISSNIRSGAMNSMSSSSTKKLSVRQRWLLLGAIALISVGAAYWWSTKLAWEEKEIDRGYSKEANQNDFLAAEIFLRKHGVQATTVKNLSLLDNHSWRNIKLGAHDTIVIVNGYKTLSEDRYGSLYEWVENGGTLITSTQNPFIGTHTDEEDVLLSDFNIELAPEEKDTDKRNALNRLADKIEKAVESDAEENDAEVTETVEKSSETDKEKRNKKTKEEKPQEYYRCSMHKTPVDIQFGSEEKPLTFDFSQSRPFIYYDYVAHETKSEDEESKEEYAPPDNDTEGAVDAAKTNEEDRHYDEKRQHLFYFDVGAGSVTITSDNYIWANPRIDCHDHAYALWRLTNPKGRVWFLINQDAPSLASILWRNASYGVLAALIALLLWLWAKSLRFGPVLVVEQTGRRSLAEHIYASAMLQWRKQAYPQLLDFLRKEILARMDEQHPNLIQATQEQRAEFLQELTGINADDIQKSLYSIALRHPQDFAAAIAHLQTIRKQLHCSKL